jgi:hypothetical protein
MARDYVYRVGELFDIYIRRWKSLNGVSANTLSEEPSKIGKGFLVARHGQMRTGAAIPRYSNLKRTCI